MSPLGGFRETGSLLLFSPRRAHLLTTPKGRWYLPLASRALCEADAASAEASRQCNSTCGCCCHRLRRRQISCVERSKSWGRNSLPPLPPACANLPPAALPQIGRRLRRHPFLFAKKKQKARAQNDGVTVRYPIFERGRKGCEFNAHPCSLASV